MEMEGERHDDELRAHRSSFTMVMMARTATHQPPPHTHTTHPPPPNTHPHPSPSIALFNSLVPQQLECVRVHVRRGDGLVEPQVLRAVCVCGVYVCMCGWVGGCACVFTCVYMCVYVCMYVRIYYISMCVCVSV
jgi:hypothetical protein